MKKIYSLLVAMLVCFGAMATQYCNTPIKSGEVAVNLTCLNPSEGVYTITVTGEGITGVGGSFCYINENETYGLATEGNFAVSENKIVFTIKSTTAPKLYTPLYIMMPGEVAFAWPEDIEWVAECGGAVEPEPEPQQAEVIYVWNGNGKAKEEAAEEQGGQMTVWLESGTNIVIGNSQKGNWAIKLNKGYKAAEQYSVLISLEQALAAGDKLTLGAFKTTDKEAVLAIEFNADTAKLNQDVVVLREELQQISTNAEPTDETIDIPAEAAGMKFIRLYRKSGSTGVYVSKFEITRPKGEIEEPIVSDYPTVAAPDAKESYPRVASVYSNRYGNAKNFDFNPNWGQSTKIEERSVENDNYLYFTNFDYQGWQFDPIVAAGLTYLHVSVWAQTTGSIDIVPIYGGQGLATDDKHRKTLATKAGEWVEYDLNLATEFAGLDLGSIFQFKYDTGKDVDVFAIDNVYFYNTEELKDTEAPKDLKVEVESVGYFDATLKVSATDNSGAVIYGAFLIVSQDSFQLLNVVAGASGAEVLLPLTLATNTTYDNIAILAMDDAENAADLILVPEFKTLAGPSSAPAPTAKAEDVISIYSDAYFPATWFNVGGWGQATRSTEVQLANGDAAMMLTNFNYLGLELNGNQPAFDASDMTHLHLDVWAPDNQAVLEVTPIWGAEKAISVGTLEAGWNQINIPLTSWAGINLQNIYQLKFDGGKGGTLFIDNIYFVKIVEDALNNVENQVVRVNNGQITINATAGEPIYIYNVAGQLIYNTVSTGMNQISLSNGQVVIVRIADSAVKVVL